MKTKTLEYVSLFSGAMGLDLGLEASGFKPAVCNEIDLSAAETIRRNRPGLPVRTQSIADIGCKELEAAAGHSLKELPLIAGGPPCQAFSVYGKRMGTVDQRGQLIFEFLRIVSELRPDTFLMENVRGLHSMAIIPKSAVKDSGFPDALADHGSLLREVFKRFEGIGYRVDCFIVNSVNYGAPQDSANV